MLEFQLFRVRVFSRAPLFPLRESPSEALRHAIESLPTMRSRRHLEWHLGNVLPLDAGGVYFRVGRISRSTIEVYRDGVFADQEFEEAPYTHVLLDVPLELCCIAKKTRLAPTANGIARQFSRLLNGSAVTEDLHAEFETDPLYDPQDLVAYLGRASAVQKFWVTFKRPNPFDADRDFQRPMQNLLGGTGGNKGKAEIHGTELIVESLEKMARAAAATGDDAAAVMTVGRQGRRVKKRLRENPVVFSQADVADDEQRRLALGQMREQYRRVLGHDQQ